jgi:Neuraminidase (sialidase)
MGWGQPAAVNGVVHYVYDARDTGTGDPGNVFYIRSTDGGVTFSAPVQLNTDATTRAQWQPNISAGADGSLVAVWYDERETTTCTKGNTTVPCYRMWARKSTDNGATWGADEAFSDVVTPLPAQPDPFIIAEYAGDYDYSFASASGHIHPWTDGRVAINSASQQDAFVDQEPISRRRKSH